MITDGAEICSDNLEVSVVSNIVFGHLEHSKMEVGDGAEGSTCYENDRLFSGVTEDCPEAVVGERIVGWIGKCIRSARRHFGRHRGV